MLQDALKDGERDRFVYYVFDLLHLDGRDLREQPLVERKAELERLLQGGESTGVDPLQRAFRRGRRAGAASTPAACARRDRVEARDAPYRSGRGETFIKTKCANARNSWSSAIRRRRVLPQAIGALAVGYYENGRLIYAGRIGTGYTQAMARDLWKRLHPLETAKPPFDQIPDDGAPPSRRALGQAEAGDRNRTSAAGPREAWCATPCSRACARTSRRRKSPGSCRP